MRKWIGYALVFAAGAIIGLFALRGPFGANRAQEDRERADAIRLLDRPPAAAQEPDTALVRAASLIQPSVVNIDTLAERRTEVMDPNGNPFERLQTLQGTGSGVIVSPDGFVVTNNHVVEGADIIRVTMIDGRKYDGRVIGGDSGSDLAVVKIDARSLPCARLGDSDRLRVGEYVLAIGNPLGIGTTVTHGIVSATNRRVTPSGEAHVLDHAIQTDAPINKGNSGGALANTSGQLVGINAAIYSATGSNIGIGFAIPINAARGVLRRLIARGRSSPPPPNDPFVGIVYVQIPIEAAAQLGIPPGRGVFVVEVKPLTPAADAGMNRGDVIMSVDGKGVRTTDDIRTAISGRTVGQTVTFGLLRGDGRQEQVGVTIGRRPQGIPKPR